MKQLIFWFSFLFCQGVWAGTGNITDNLQQRQSLTQYYQLLTPLIAQNNVDKLSQLIKFPIRIYGGSPAVSIDNAADFKRYYAAIFTPAFKEQLKQSSVDELFISWRGAVLSLKDGSVMFSGECLNEQCSRVSTSIRTLTSKAFYQSKIGQKAQQKIRQQQRHGLYQGLQRFKQNQLIWKTANHLVRIDQLNDGSYRYAVWSANAAMSSKPELVLQNGQRIADGNGGNHYYQFQSGPYQYRCRVWVLGTDTTPPGTLVVQKKDKIVLTEDVVSVVSN